MLQGNGIDHRHGGGHLACNPLRPFQQEVLELAREQNVVLVGATGIGKTFVAIALLNEQDYSQDKRAFFLAPTRQLVLQITAKIQLQTSLRVNAYCGSAVDLWDGQQWQDELQLTKVCVCTPEILRNILEKGYITMDRINLLVFDECHHVSKRHPYAHVIKRYDASRINHMPRIFGTTACPTKTCAEKLHATLKRIDMEDTFCVEYAACAPILYETYDDPDRDDGEDPGCLEKNKSMVVVKELQQFQVMDVFAKLLLKTKCQDQDGYAKQEKKMRKFLTTCVTIYNSLGPWCFYRYVELELTRTAISMAPVAIPGTHFGMDKDALRTVLLLSEKRELCNFACKPKLAKVLQVLDERFFGADTDVDVSSSRKASSDESSSTCSEEEPETNPEDGPQDLLGESNDAKVDCDLQSRSSTNDKKKDQLLQGIIFARTRIECRVLTDFLNEKYSKESPSNSEHPATQNSSNPPGAVNTLSDVFSMFSLENEESSGIFACVLGQAGRSDTASYDLPNTKTLFHRFERHKIRVLVSTSVSVEGVDFPMCGLVIVTHEINSARTLIQLRGRARHDDGVVFYLGEVNTPRDRVQFLKLMHEADSINRLDFSQDKEETIFQKPRAEMAVKLQNCGLVTEENRIQIPSTGAILDLDSSISCLNMFCQSLPKPLYTYDPKDLFGYEEDIRVKTKVFKAVCRLPEDLDLDKRVFESDWSISKSVAKAASAFLACKALLECGLLDSQLNSVYRKSKSRPVGSMSEDSARLDFFIRRLHAK